MRIAFISPRLPPSVCGIADHTTRLARALRDQLVTTTAIYRHGSATDSALPFDHVDCWDGEAQTLAALLAKHHSTCLWVQYSGYGYAWQGLPFYLPRALQALRGRIPIVVYFHETHCRVSQLGLKGIVISPLQRRIGRNLARSADIVFTSCPLYQDLIARDYAVPGAKLVQLPLGANVPIPIVTPAERKRLRSVREWKPAELVAATFGSDGRQEAALRRNRALLVEALRKKQIHRIVCVGGSPSQPRDRLVQALGSRFEEYITALGHQTSAQVGETLLAADVAFTGYPAECFGKSGTVAAYALAGLPLLTPISAALTPSDDIQARLIHLCDMRGLAAAVADEPARALRRQHALATIGWDALATRALSALQQFTGLTNASSTEAVGQTASPKPATRI